MNKTEFIGIFSKQAEISKVSAKKAVDSFIKTIEQSLKTGEKVSFFGFGTFSIVEKAARRGINPKTKLPLTIPARKTVKFKPGAGLSKVAH